MQQYLTLDEAASKLHMSPDELREMAKKKQIRAFQDRGSWRFRAQDIEELARSRGLGSDAELQLSEADAKKGHGTNPAADLPSDEEVPIGREKLTDKGTRTASKSGPRSPAPKPGGDSDVRLVMDDDMNFPIDSEERKGDSKASRTSKLTAGDSGVRLVKDRPSDSDVKVVPDPRDPSGSGKSKSPSDSDIRLQDLPSAQKSDPNLITEEIDLDAEAAKVKEQPKPAGKPKVTRAANPASLPTSSPFELSESDFSLETPSSPPPKAPKAPKTPGKAKGDSDSSSDFELIPFDASKSPVELGSGDLPLLSSDEEIDLGAAAGRSSGNSGINLQDPADSGISLEQGGSDELEFELSLDSGSTPKPAPRKADEDSSSEFELSLDDEPSSDASSSEFELSLDDSGDEINLKKMDEPSDSEFELTLDDEGGLAVDEDAKDIFDATNFDVPALEDDSGSEAVALDESDTDLEGSDFEISLDDDSATGDQSDSQVVDLDSEEEADAAAGTVVKPKKSKSKSKAAAAVADDEIPSLDDDLEVNLDDAPVSKKKRKVQDDDLDIDEEEEEETVPAAATDWGPVPAILLFPTVIVLFVVGLMGFEMVQSMWAYHRPARVAKPIIHTLASQFDDSLPKD